MSIKSDRDYITIFTAGYPINKQARMKGCKVVKTTAKPFATATAVTCHVSDEQSLAEIIQHVSQDPCSVISLGFVKGTEPGTGETFGEPYTILSVAGIETGGGVPDHEDPNAPHWYKMLNGDRAISRTKHNFTQGCWFLIDRDFPYGMPDHLANLSFDEFCDTTNILMSGFTEAPKVFCNSSGARILGPDGAATSRGLHVYVQTSRPDLVQVLGHSLNSRALLEDLSFKTGPHTTQTIADTKVFSPERVVYTGAPTVSKPLAIADADIRTTTGKRLDLSNVVTFTKPQRRALNTRHNITYRRDSPGGHELRQPYGEDGLLKLATIIATADHGHITVAEGWKLLLAGVTDKIRCQCVFAVSNSMNAYMVLDYRGRPVLRENGRLAYRLSTKERRAAPNSLPTYKTACVSVIEARKQLALRVISFFDRIKRMQEPHTRPEASEIPAQTTSQTEHSTNPPVLALKVSTGVGKSQAIIKNFTGQMAMFCPTQELCEAMAERIRATGKTAEVLKGRTQEGMCNNLEAVELAVKTGQPVFEACCKSAGYKCKFYDTCKYIGQLKREPDAYVMPHNYLYHPPIVAKNADVVVIDEGRYVDAGIGQNLKMPLDEFETDAHGWLGEARCEFSKRCRKQSEGPVAGHTLLHSANTLIGMEWKLLEEHKMKPGMSLKQCKALALQNAALRTPFRVGVWKAIAKMDGKKSGHLSTHRTEEGKLEIHLRERRKISKGWKKPMILLDATLADLKVLKQYISWLDRRDIVEVNARLPFAAQVRQVTHAQMTNKKLLEGQHKLHKLRNYILKRWIEFGRGKTLVVCQKAVEAALKRMDLPDNIHIAHFNAIAGLDGFKDVRLLITVGRTLPSPGAVESISGVLTGEAVDAAVGWYYGEYRHIKMTDGGTHLVKGDKHPDAFAEAARWQVCEGELIQAVGRGRGVNRHSGSPLQVDIIADVCIPVDVDEVVDWDDIPVSDDVLAMLDGVFVTNIADVCKIWPEIAKNRDQVRRWQSGRFSLVEILYKKNAHCGRPVRFWYQKSGARQKWTQGYFWPEVVPMPRKWLTERLGLLSGFEIERIEDEQPEGLYWIRHHVVLDQGNMCVIQSFL